VNSWILAIVMPMTMTTFDWDKMRDGVPMAGVNSMAYYKTYGTLGECQSAASNDVAGLQKVNKAAGYLCFQGREAPIRRR
jgi:hypothetical protein